MNCKYLKTMTKRCSKLNKIVTYKDCANCEYKEYKLNSTERKRTAMKTKSKKLTKLEKNRWSVFTDDLDICIMCGKPKEHLHEIFEGSNRKKSMEYGFVLPLCNEDHRKIHSNRQISIYYKQLSQIYFESHYGSRNEFIEAFKRNYLDTKK